MKRYTEKNVPMPGWFWFTPQYPESAMSRSPYFVHLFSDVTNNDLTCKRYAGTYVGPINTAQFDVATIPNA